jgi:chaperone required for assembly of F1-ATPase
MREILNDLDASLKLSDPDPVRRAQIQMKAPLPNRFYKTVSVEAGDSGFVVKLDGRTARTPARVPIELPTEQSAQLVAAEFDAQQEIIDPVTMPTMRLVNTAIDGVSREIDAVLEDILRFAASDLLCYRAGAPEGLVERQNEAWDDVLDWARSSLGARLNLAEGVIHVEQPRESIAMLGLHLRQRAEPFRLAAMHLMTSITGSALLALAVDAGERDAEAAWLAAHIDEDWQIEHWGKDSEAMARRAQRKRDFMAAARLIAAL